PSLSSTVAPAPTRIHPLPLHDALPIWNPTSTAHRPPGARFPCRCPTRPYRSGRLTGVSRPFRSGGGRPPDESIHVTLLLRPLVLDRKSTRLNSSHVSISYAVFCLKKKK